MTRPAITDPKPGAESRSPEWPRVRQEHLAKFSSCANCGETNGLIEVHHIQPFHLHPELELDPTNLITLCENPGHGDCHFAAGHLLDWHSFNVAVAADAAAFLAKVQTRPRDDGG